MCIIYICVCLYCICITYHTISHNIIQYHTTSINHWDLFQHVPTASFTSLHSAAQAQASMPAAGPVPAASLVQSVATVAHLWICDAAKAPIVKFCCGFWLRRHETIGNLKRFRLSVSGVNKYLTHLTVFFDVFHSQADRSVYH